MDAYRIIISELAKQDIRDTATHIANEFQEPVIAEKTADAILNAIFTLESMPDRIGFVKDKRLADIGIRPLYVKNYTVFFRIDESTMENGIDFPVRVYKNRYTFNTTIVIGGEDYYKIAEGTGQWGVVTCNYFADGEDRYLIYSYSRDHETDEKLSYIGIFDLNSREEIYRSEAFAKYDITINERSEERHYSVAFMTHFEDGYGGGGGSLVSELGYLKYEEGEFNLYIANA